MFFKRRNREMKLLESMVEELRIMNLKLDVLKKQRMAHATKLSNEINEASRRMCDASRSANNFIDRADNVVTRLADMAFHKATGGP